MSKIKQIFIYFIALVLGVLCGLGICGINHAQAARKEQREPIASTPIYTETEDLAAPKPVPSTPIYNVVEQSTQEIVQNFEEIHIKTELEEELEKEEVEVKEEPETAPNKPSPTDEVYKVVNGIPVTYKEIEMLGLTIWGEANGQTKIEQAAVAWAILNRVDDTNNEGYACGHSITYVLEFPGYAPGQIHGYWNTKGAKCTDYYYDLAKDVIDRWALEHEGVEIVGRVLPKEYTHWAGKKDSNGVWHNYFRTAYKTNEPRWDWSLPNPYEE